jgi:hypothetical protein
MNRGITGREVPVPFFLLWQHIKGGAQTLRELFSAISTWTQHIDDFR